MAKYFGHRPAWARPKATGGFAMPPPAPTGNLPGKYGMPSGALDGQIIPPNRGQYPKGRSLPGLSAEMAANAARRAAAARALMMAGKLARAQLPFALLDMATMLEDWMGPNEPVTVPAQWLGNGWSRCATPNWTGVCGPEPAPELWDWQGTGVFNSSCSNGTWGVCPKNQFSAYNDPLGSTIGWPSNVTSVVFSRLSPGTTNRYDLIRRYVRPSVVGQTTPYPEYVPARTRMPVPATPPFPHLLDRSYGPPRTRVPVKAGPANRPQPPSVRKEEKWVLPTNHPLQRFWGALTEGMDAADCMEKAVRATGAKRKRGENGRTGQMKFLARSLSQGHGDPGVFFACMASEGLQDKVIGKVNSAAAQAAGKNPYYKRPAGPGFGGWGQRMR